MSHPFARDQRTIGVQRKGAQRRVTAFRFWDAPLPRGTSPCEALRAARDVPAHSSDGSMMQAGDSGME